MIREKLDSVNQGTESWEKTTVGTSFSTRRGKSPSTLSWGKGGP